MKTKEFIRKIEELEFECVESDGWFYLRDLKFNDNFLAEICINEPFIVDTGSCEFGMLPQTRKIRLFDLIIEYARTPIEDREEEKKFYLEHKNQRSVDGSALYFTLYISHNFLLVKSQVISENLKQKFTLKEIEEIKEKYDTDLADFELVEVEDVD